MSPPLRLRSKIDSFFTSDIDQNTPLTVSNGEERDDYGQKAVSRTQVGFSSGDIVASADTAHCQTATRMKATFPARLISAQPRATIQLTDRRSTPFQPRIPMIHFKYVWPHMRDRFCPPGLVDTDTPYCAVAKMEENHYSTYRGLLLVPR